jgi:putative colanic acid biosynthesis acetyltransferase WcaF
MNRDLSAFSGSKKFSLIAKIRLVMWFCVQHIIFKSSFFPTRLRPYFLRIFGASVGKGVLIRRGVRIHFPWSLEIGNNSWIGEDVWIVNHEKISIGSDVCISQRSIICSGGHDFRSSTLEFDHSPVEIKNGAWLCLDSKVLAGVSIGECSVISAGEVVRKSVPDYSLLIGGTIRPIEPPE